VYLSGRTREGCGVEACPHWKAHSTLEEIPAHCGLSSEGLSGEVDVGVRCCSFHEVGFRALSEGLEIPNDFAIWANNLRKDCTVTPGDTCTV
jgi:hypothetical protein